MKNVTEITSSHYSSNIIWQYEIVLRLLRRFDSNVAVDE